MQLAFRVVSIIACLLALIPLRAEIVATYLGNEGVLVVHGDSKILFDPLYRNSFGQYQLVPPDTVQAIMAGRPPFDGVDAVFISHFHEDHFSPADIAMLLQQRPGVRLFAPVQAVAMLRELVDDEALFERVIGVDLEYGDPPVTIEEGTLSLAAVRIPHSGWPATHTDVQNIAFRVTLNDSATILHIGDADTRDEHYARDAEHWNSAQIDLAFPPYWYFSSTRGRHVLATRLKPRHSVGVHVPVEMPDNPAQRPAEFRGYDLFTEPGQTRRIDDRNIDDETFDE